MRGFFFYAHLMRFGCYLALKMWGLAMTVDFVQQSLISVLEWEGCPI